MRISVLIPSRGRPENLRRAVQSMLDLESKADIEFLFRFDVDDPHLQANKRVVDSLATWSRLVLSKPRGAGYRDVYKMYNEMARLSRGDWIISWNDDVEMLTKGWDNLLCQAPPHSVQFMRRDILPSADTTFPVTGRSVYQAMGHLSLQVHADDWMGRVAEGASVRVDRNDVVFHHHRLNDQTSWERDHGGYDPEGFNSPEMVALREKDIENVKRGASK